ncbi:hypothetical protein GA0070216_12622 [Micromonospora matsumotoense]|uniref:Uncharacterized protein n=2 Tax=Micromonospora matsumotoense TaxID=121616 RepID=A0A1C5AST6_9ACTN|nr:hypothetical protein GA0070216_12622 [Micromonospora matsumotoense]
MVNLPAARRHHRSRIRYAFGLLALIGVVVTLVVVTRYPAESATRLAEPVPAPEITVVEWGDTPTVDPGPGTPADAPADPGPGTPADPGPDAPAGPGPDAAVEPHGAQSGVGGGASTLAEPRHPSDDPQTVAQSLFYSGLLGLAISLAGLGLVGTRRRMW